MKRFHVHVSVDNLDASIRFYFPYPRYDSRFRRQVARADGPLLRNRADRRFHG